jgi:hypothetical protein
MAATGQTGPFFAYFSGVVMATIDTIPIAGGQVPTPGLGNAVVVSSSFGSGFTTGVSFPLQSAAYVQAADVAAVTPATVLYGTTINFGASSVNGTHHAPANADVRHGTANGVSPAAGTAYIPAASNVRYGTSVDATTGTCHVPTAAQTLYGVSVDVSDTGTVALPNTDGSTPDASLVKSTAHFGAGNATAGTLDTASIATEAASAQHTIDAEFLTTHANEIISADTFILSEFGIAGLAAGGGGGGSSNNPY